jgi:hypothetical protein
VKDFAIALFIVILLAAFVEASDRNGSDETHRDRDRCEISADC